MTIEEQNSPTEDTEAHGRIRVPFGADVDQSGNRRGRHPEQQEDDTEGHAAGAERLTDDDQDTAGHGSRIRL